MTYTEEREEFAVKMTAEGVPLYILRKVMREANTIQRLAAVACSDEYADRDRIACPAGPDWRGVKGMPCLCSDYGSNDGETHGTVPRYMIRDYRAQKRITALLAPYKVRPIFGGDPRGACVKLEVPSGKTDDWGQVGICVPTREY